MSKRSLDVESDSRVSKNEKIERGEVLGKSLYYYRNPLKKTKLGKWMNVCCLNSVFII